jgi:NADPH:quinone reductase-like Zn-dependent oxidoreductase
MTDASDMASPNRSTAARRSQGQVVVARALWYVKPGVAELRPERLDPPGPGEARVATRFSAFSRGTERLVALGEVPRSEWDAMRAPLQAGSFPFPVKYGYAAAGVVTAGPPALLGQRVFSLHPHQDHFQVAAAMLTAIPDAVSDKRATLAANMETALNAHWDAGAGPGDRILIIGAGVVGLLVAYLARRIAGCDVAIVDIDQSRAAVAGQLGLKFFSPVDAPTGNRIVFHTSATSAGLDAAIASAGFEGRIVELSWYGAQPVTVCLGGAFHSKRLSIISSQVGHVAPSRRAGVTRQARLAAAMSLLDDPCLDVLVSDEVQFDGLAQTIPGVFTAPELAPVIAYA